MKPLIIISGSSGTGKSTAAKAIAKELKLKHVSAGDKMRILARELGFKTEGQEFLKFHEYVKTRPEIDRKLDELIIKDSSKRSCVVDSRLAAYLIKKPSFKILLKVPDIIAAKRNALREGISKNEALKAIRKRNNQDMKRYKSLYKIDVNDSSVYDLILDTSYYDINEMNDILIYVLKKLM